MKNLLVTKTRKTFSDLIDIDTRQCYTAYNDEVDADLITGTLFKCEIECGGEDYRGTINIESMVVLEEIIGDSKKQKFLIDATQVKIGDLIDNIPVLGIGKKFAKEGKKVAYAYFK